MKSEKDTAPAPAAKFELQSCLFAHTSEPGVVIGVVSAVEPSSLALLAAGVAGMAARRARRKKMK